MNYGQRIRYIRKQEGLTQKELGLCLGLIDSSATAVISQYEKNEKKPKLQNQKVLANALDVYYRLLFSNRDIHLVNIYIDLYWLLLEGKDVVYISYLLDRIKEKDKVNFALFEQLLN